MKEPIRMQETEELPAALREAFGALGRDAPSAETVLRVQQTLQALPAASAGAGAAGTLGLGKLLVVVSLVAGAVTTGVVLKQRLAAPPSQQPTHEIVQAAPELVPAPSSAGVQTDMLSVAASEASEPAALPAPNARPASERTASPASPRPRPRAHAATAQPSAELSPQWVKGLLAPSRSGSEVPSASGDHAASSASDPAASTEQARTLSAAAASAHDAQATALSASVAAAQASEAQRLAQCKRLAARDPADALQKLEALARDVPHGVFLQERELLEIRLHERLGHQATAAELRQRFLTRYPGSVYGRALAP